MNVKEAPQHKTIDIIPICSDYDDECIEVESPVKCWLYMPECGQCPLLKGDQ